MGAEEGLVVVGAFEEAAEVAAIEGLDVVGKYEGAGMVGEHVAPSAKGKVTREFDAGITAITVPLVGVFQPKAK